MTRSFDAFDRDDFRTPDYDSEHGMGSGSTSSWDKWRELQNIHREEERSDALARETHQRSDRERRQVPREQRVRMVMEQRTRTAFTDRNRTYSPHSNLHVTNKYLQATPESKRLAQGKLVDAIIPGGLLSASKSTLIQ